MKVCCPKFLIEKTLWDKFKAKCDIYDVPAKDILTEFMQKFVSGELDKAFNMPEIPDIIKEDFTLDKKLRF